MEKPKPVNLEKWFEMNIVERADFLLARGELTEFSRQILLTCDDLKLHGAIIPEETILEYYKNRKHLMNIKE